MVPRYPLFRPMLNAVSPNRLACCVCEFVGETTLSWLSLIVEYFLTNFSEAFHRALVLFVFVWRRLPFLSLLLLLFLEYITCYLNFLKQ